MAMRASGMMLAGLLLGGVGPSAFAADRVLRADLEIGAPVQEVFDAWTTETGMRTFFAPVAHVEARVDGVYDVLFFPDRPAGQRGAEGMRILAYEPPRRFAFTWNAPPTIPAIRAQRNVVVIELEPIDAKRTRFRFSHIGWGDGADWTAAYDYFDRAWGAVVLPRFVYRFEHGPLDWKAMPQLAELPSLKKDLR
jgi:uncharacterized protein YndB with AHSA1/START domain